MTLTTIANSLNGTNYILTSYDGAKFLEERKYPRPVREIAELLGIRCEEAAATDLKGQIDILRKLETALSVECELGRENAWFYDSSRRPRLGAAIKYQIGRLAETYDETSAAFDAKIEELAHMNGEFDKGVAEVLANAAELA
jgi:hypothetical protein